MGPFKRIGLFLTLWVCSLVLSFLLELEASYASSHADHAEANNRLLDCRLPHFAVRYPKDCARVVLEPPRMFVFSWAATAMSRVNLCGPVPCESFLTVRGLVAVCGLGLVTGLPRMIFNS